MIGWRRWLAVLVVAVFALDVAPPLVDAQVAWAQGDDDKPKKKKRRKRRRRKKRRKKAEEKKPVAEPVKDSGTPTAEELRIEAEKRRLEIEKRRVEAAKKKREAEGRKMSALRTGAPSRWSNRGAMEPIVSEVPVTAPLPQRNVPKPVGVETPGQKLFEGDEVLSARLSLSGTQLTTRGQDQVFDGPNLVPDRDRDIQLLRGRATLAYQHIAGSDFGAHVDLEYRPSYNVSRFTDQRVNELYVSYGLTDFRGGASGPAFGVALGRLAIREAGYAQADGAAVRVRLLDELHLGAFGGITGNPYGYNWRLRSSEFVSADWITGGLFSAVRVGPFAANVAGVVTVSNSSDVLGVENGIDRVYAALDLSYLIAPDLNVFAQGKLDVLPSGQLIQNLELTGTWTPSTRASVSASVGRFSTVVYEQSARYTYEVDPAGNLFLPNDPQVGNRQIVDEDGNPILPFDAALFTTVYNQARVRGGYRVLREVEIYGSLNALLRDFSSTNDALAELGIDAQVPGSSLRLLPAAGARYRNPDIVDLNVELTGVLDDRSNTDAIVAAGIGRDLFGLYLGADVRRYLGAIAGTDAGVNLAYTLPRDWLPGAFILRGTVRYFQENVLLIRPDLDPDGNEIENDDGQNRTIQGTEFTNQQTVFLFAGAEWRL